jgi:hypothetical protein
MTDYEDDSAEEKPEAEGAAAPGISESDADILSMVRRARKESDKHLGDWMKEAREMFDLVSGEQWSQSDKAKLEEMGRVPVVFNRIGPVVDSICGTEVNNRQQVQFIPRTPGDSGVNEVLTGAAQWVRDQCDAEDEESDAFFDVVVCGLGWTETHLETSDDPEGQVLIERRDPMSMRYDPAAKKRNLADMKWVQRDEFLCKEEIEEKWEGCDVGMPTVDEIANQEGRAHDATTAWTYRDNASGWDQQTGKYLVIHHQWYTLETFWRMVDPATGQMVDMPDDRMQAMAKKMPQIQSAAVRLQRKIYKQAFVCGGCVLEKSLLPVQGAGFTFKALTGKRDRNNNTWYGIVRPMADPQRWANKFFSQILHIINSNAKGGLMVEEGAVDNVRKLEDTWAQSDSINIFNEGALSGNKVQPKPMPAYPVGPERLMEFAVSSIRDTSGVNLELLGMADRQQAGYLESQRKESGLVILATFFDSLRRYRKMQGRLLAEFIQNYLSDGRLVRIVGGDGAERYVPLLKQQEVLKYDIVVDESPTSHNVKERVFMMLMNMLPGMQKMGMPPPPLEVVDYLPIPSSLSEKWKQQALQMRQQDPMQGEKMKLTAQMQMRQAELQHTAQLKQMEQQFNAQLESAKMRMQQEVDRNRQASEAEQHAMRVRQDAELEALKAHYDNQRYQRELQFQKWKAELDAAVKVQTANIASQAKINDAATQAATGEIAADVQQ